MRSSWRASAASYVIQAAREKHEDSDEDNPIVIAKAETMPHEMAVKDAMTPMNCRGDGQIGWIDPAGKKSRVDQLVA